MRRPRAARYSPDPEIAGVAALIGDAGRASMLVALLDGRQLPAGELAFRAGMSATAASGHLAKLVAGGLLRVERAGRQRLYHVANGDVAHAIEALAVIAKPARIAALSQQIIASELHVARSCYDHVAGRLGVGLTDALVRRRAIVRAGPSDYRVTRSGHAFFTASASISRKRARSDGISLGSASIGPSAGRISPVRSARRCARASWIAIGSAATHASRALRITAAGRTAFKKSSRSRSTKTLPSRYPHRPRGKKSAMLTRRSVLASAAALAALTTLPRAARAAAAVRVGMIPDAGATQLSIEQKKPLRDYLAAKLGRDVDLVIPTNYNATVEALGNGSLDFAYLGGLTYVKAHALYGVVPLVQRNTDRQFHSLFITQTASPINGLKDLRGKKFAFGDINSTSGHLMPFYAMSQAGLDPDKDVSCRYTGNHPATAKAVEAGVVDAGAMDESVYHAMVDATSSTRAKCASSTPRRRSSITCGSRAKTPRPPTAPRSPTPFSRCTRPVTPPSSTSSAVRRSCARTTRSTTCCERSRRN